MTPPPQLREPVQQRLALAKRGAAIAHLSIVLDTNAYRRLGPARFAAMRELEAKHQVRAYAAYHTMLELIASTLDTSKGKRGSARASLRRLYEHCTDLHVPKPQTRFIVSGAAQAAHDLFRQYNAEYEERAQLMPALVYWLYTRDDMSWADQRPIVESLRGERDRLETEFARALFESVVKHLCPDASSWFDITRSPVGYAKLLDQVGPAETQAVLGRSIVLRAARLVGRTVATPDLDTLAARARTTYPVPVAFLDSLIRDIITLGHDMSKPERANSVWDYEICFSVQHRSRIADAPAWLISADKEILRAGKMVECTNVRSLDEYECLLQGTPEDFQKELERCARAC